MTKQMALESQLYEAKIAKLEMETAAEKEVLLREKQQLLLVKILLFTLSSHSRDVFIISIVYRH